MKSIYPTTLFGILMLSMSVISAETLDTVIDKTLQTNPELQASQNQVFARQQQLEQARSGYYPSLDLIAGIGRETSESPSTGFNEETLTRQELKIELRQNLFQGFATESAVAQQEANVASADSALADDRNVIALRVSDSYIKVLRDRKIVAMAEDFVKNHEAIYKKIEKRSKSGVGLKSEREHAAGRLALAKSNLISAQANLDDSIINYLAVVGAMPPDDMALPESKVISENLQMALTTARDRNPAIARARAEMQAAVEGRNASKSGYYPEVDLVLSGSRNEDLDGIEGDDDDQSIMLQLRYNLFAGGSDSAREMQSSYEVERSKNIRDNTYRLVEQKVRFAWNELESRRNQLVSLKQHLDASVRSRDVYSDQYRIGKRSLLDLLDTENELFNARINYANAQHVMIISQHKLLAHMGMLVE